LIDDDISNFEKIKSKPQSIVRRRKHRSKSEKLVRWRWRCRDCNFERIKDLEKILKEKCSFSKKKKRETS